MAVNIYGGARTRHTIQFERITSRPQVDMQLDSLAPMRMLNLQQRLKTINQQERHDSTSQARVGHLIEFGIFEMTISCNTITHTRIRSFQREITLYNKFWNMVGFNLLMQN